MDSNRMASARRPDKNNTPINLPPRTTGSPPRRYVDPLRWQWRSRCWRQSKPAGCVSAQLFPPTRFASCEDSTLQALCPTKGERSAMSIVRIAALILIAGTIAAQQPPSQPAPVPPVLENYKPATAERLKKPE